ncbi:Asp23/Gls24 family envelope stress response protein [Streptomyces fuscigenes]|uniref:Asp23/Gls24 family envelope stress response protein n=1 Tax=Streptomyces fuscigenes TaxID=1528880 RepID=UPI001F29A56D|nr:Asp23/Gls24 family envelope stress response protein [Streptomyces fuscigenes]MCF3960545.1 Asp23/Gls24 family envelope stress response protein [Streptomyces fuscigenes]
MVNAAGRRELAGNLTRAIADAVVAIDGVAFLRPGFADVVRGVGRRSTHPVSGVRVAYEAESEQWRITVQLVTGQGHRALDVTRAVRAAATSAATKVLSSQLEHPPTATGEQQSDAGRSLSVTVTVTGVV